jgi:predicted ferric reductase
MNEGRGRGISRKGLALAWLALYLALVALPLVILMLAPRPPGSGRAWDFAIALGVGLFALMAIMFVLTARFRRATAPFGIDAIYYYHRQAAYLIAVLALAHPLILLYEEPLLLAYLGRSGPWYLWAGVVSFLALVVLVVSSLVRRLVCLHYDFWRRLHVASAVVAVAGATGHIFGAGYYSATPGTGWLWAAIPASAAALFVYVRLIRPWLARGRPYRIARIEDERGRARTLHLQPDGHGGLRFTPGQFVWLNWRASPFALREHPFSISSGDADLPALGLTIKELGDFTASLAAARPGDRVTLDGPYGSFCADDYPAPGYLFIAGGIGIAPMLSMLRSFASRGDRRPMHLFYAYRDLDSLTGREEIERLKTRLDLRVTIVLSQPPPGWTGERGWPDAAMFARHWPENARELHYFICGPRPMMRIAEQALRDRGVRFAQIHVEIFDLV